MPRSQGVPADWARDVPRCAMPRCAMWQSQAGGRRAVAEEAPSFLLLPSHPSSILSPSLSCILPAWTGSGPAPQWDPQGGRVGGPHCGDPVPPRALLPAPSRHHNFRPNSCAVAAAPQPPRHGTTQHGMAWRWGPAVHRANAGSDPPAHRHQPWHRPQHCQVSPGLSPSHGLAVGLGGEVLSPWGWGGPLSPRVGFMGREMEPLGQRGGGRMGWGDSASRDGAPPDVGRGGGT